MPDARARRVLVSGASGFVGACAVRRLRGQGHDVHVLLRGEARTWRLRDVIDGLAVHRADLRDPGAVRGAVRDSRPDAVLHLAAYGAYEPQADGPRILETNVVGTQNLLQALAAFPPRLLVNAGSSSEYGYRDTPMAEGDRLEPNSVYAVAKAAQTHLCRLSAAQGVVPAVTFRLFSVYGPWEEPTRLIPTLLRRAQAGLPLEMAAPGIARDFVHVDDVLDAMLDFAGLERHSGEVFNLGTGVETTLEGVVALVQEVVGRRCDVRWGAMPPRRWDHTSWRADTRHVRETLGWEARRTLEQGLRAFRAWMEAARDPYEAIAAV
jgi:nucleoside-diphosphate-sugar epimerase